MAIIKREESLEHSVYYTEAQLQAEMNKCLYCHEKPCAEACPSHCSPADFIMAARQGAASDYGRAGEMILKNNPLGEVCGVVCPDAFCMDACSKKTFDAPINIPKVQATILRLARQMQVLRRASSVEKNVKKVAVVGAGPSGLTASAVLARKGYEISLYDSHSTAGGACALIPENRLPRDTLKNDIDYILKLGHIKTQFGMTVRDPRKLLDQHDAVLVSIGQPLSDSLGISGEELAVSATDYLRDPKAYPTLGKVAVLGGGAVAADCAMTAKSGSAASVEMFVRRTIGEMRLTRAERERLIESGIDITTRTRIQAVEKVVKTGFSLRTTKVEPASVGGKTKLVDIEGTETVRPGYSLVILAIGNRSPELHPARGIFYAGDCEHGASTVVEAVASGKNAALAIDLFLDPDADDITVAAARRPGTRSKIKSRASIAGISAAPVDLATDFFGYRLESPFLLSAAPATDGFEQMKKAFEAGWAGGVMKTAFDNLPIHIPNNYMVAFNEATYGNCDNVSGHALDRVCEEIGRLRALFPSKLVMGSTGGPVTGHDERDAKGWQSNTKKIERAGAMAVEYSLSCPQGGDGTEGDIVSQNAKTTAKVIDWVLQVSDPSIPKLFKLTSAVTSIKPIMKAVADVLAKHPGKKAGVTLANSFPVMAFRRPWPGSRAAGEKREWDEGVIVGMSGDGVVPMSYLALANAAPFGVTISGNGGVMNYRSAANFLALGCGTVQVCTIVMKHGLGIIDELNSGLSHFMASRGIGSVSELVGRASPNAITGFGDLTPVKQVSAVRAELCQSCGNCVNCGYMAISLNQDKHPVTDPSRCVGCSICALACFSGALYMRDRTSAELSALKEH